ncbi:TolC family protein [Atopomonas sediminilitoris]|uniref:TolC family protein n=1 Tax=Atopomonas sediminilitoris TaxID=2919919 RepID=UPI001F4ECAE5|nr:TolC family protein [Atopomonas sediminilitoris]MCJ8168967.1 TolC family protein [Atopomonas sediminilitoris]
MSVIFSSPVVPRVLALGVLLLASQASLALTLDQALQQALAQAPSLKATAAGVDAAEQARIPAAALPDPVLKLGVQNVPVENDQRFRLDREPMTMQMLGLMQEVPSRAKRAAWQQQADATLGSAQAAAHFQAQSVAAQTAAAWLRAWASEQRLALFPALIKENRLLDKAVQVRLAAGLGLAAERLVPRQQAALLHEQQDALHAQRKQNLAQLARWTASPAPAVEGGWPQWPVQRARYRQALLQHPALRTAAAQTRGAEADVALAVADKTPDWAWEVAYQNRDPAFGDMVSLQVSMDLPLFVGSRQGPRIAAEQARLSQTQAQRDDLRLQLQAELEQGLAELERLQLAVRRSEQTLLPLATQRAQLALADYRGGQGSLTEVIAARRELIETQLRDIDLREQQSLTNAALYFAFDPQHQEPALYHPKATEAQP